MGLIEVTSLDRWDPRYVTEAPAVTEGTEANGVLVLGKEFRC